MTTANAQETPARGCQSLLAPDGTPLFHGFWDPRAIARVCSQDSPAYWQGRRVLDIGANTSGLSVEIARAGGRVVALEPDPFENTRAAVRPVLDRLIAEEGLDITLRDEGLFEAGEVDGPFDTVLCLGLVYHFRDPQYVLDWLSQLEMEHLIVSTQTGPGAGLQMTNRRDPEIGLPEWFWETRTDPLSGWHPTHALFVKMLGWAGFRDVVALTPPMAFPTKPQPGLTNSAYFRATRGETVYPLASRQTYLQY